jgi:hypothetical protein
LVKLPLQTFKTVFEYTDAVAVAALEHHQLYQSNYHHRKKQKKYYDGKELCGA